MSKLKEPSPTELVERLESIKLLTSLYNLDLENPNVVRLNLFCEDYFLFAMSSGSERIRKKAQGSTPRTSDVLELASEMSSVDYFDCFVKFDSFSNSPTIPVQFFSCLADLFTKTGSFDDAMEAWRSRSILGAINDLDKRSFVKIYLSMLERRGFCDREFPLSRKKRSEYVKDALELEPIDDPYVSASRIDAVFSLCENPETAYSLVSERIAKTVSESLDRGGIRGINVLSRLRKKCVDAGIEEIFEKDYASNLRPYSSSHCLVYSVNPKDLSLKYDMTESVAAATASNIANAFWRIASEELCAHPDDAKPLANSVLLDFRDEKAKKEAEVLLDEFSSELFDDVVENARCHSDGDEDRSECARILLYEFKTWRAKRDLDHKLPLKAGKRSVVKT